MTMTAQETQENLDAALMTLVDALRAGPRPALDFEPDLVKAGLDAGFIAGTGKKGKPNPKDPGNISLTARGLEYATTAQMLGTPIMGIDITETGLRITGVLSKEACVEILRRLRRIRGIYHSALADVMMHARTHHGEDFVNEALQQLEFDFIEVQKAEGIQHVPLTLRDRFNLTSEHAYELGRAFPDDIASQEEWAEKAREHDLSALALKRSIATGEIRTEEEIQHHSGKSSGITVINGLITTTFKRWVNQVGGREKILDWDPETKQEFLDEVKELVDLAAEVKHSLE